MGGRTATSYSRRILYGPHFMSIVNIGECCVFAGHDTLCASTRVVAMDESTGRQAGRQRAYDNRRVGAVGWEGFISEIKATLNSLAWHCHDEYNIQEVSMRLQRNWS